MSTLKKFMNLLEEWQPWSELIVPFKHCCYIYIQIYVCMCIFVCMCVYVCVCRCIYVYMCIFVNRKLLLLDRLKVPKLCLGVLRPFLGFLQGLYMNLYYYIDSLYSNLQNKIDWLIDWLNKARVLHLHLII